MADGTFMVSVVVVLSSALYTQAEMPRLTSIFDPKVATLSAYFERVNLLRAGINLSIKLINCSAPPSCSDQTLDHPVLCVSNRTLIYHGASDPSEVLFFRHCRGNIAVDSLICVGSVWTMVNNTARTSERPVE